MFMFFREGYSTIGQFKVNRLICILFLKFNLFGFFIQFFNKVCFFMKTNSYFGNINAV